MAASLFAGQVDLIRELEDIGSITGNLRSLAVAAWRSRQTAKGELVTLAVLRRIIRMMGGK